MVLVKAPEQTIDYMHCKLSSLFLHVSAYSQQLSIGYSLYGLRVKITVEFALHPPHETSRDPEIQTKEDFKSKFRKQLLKLVDGIIEIVKSKKMYWNTKSRIIEWTEFQENEVEQSNN